jgi:hypothetical protein
MAEDKPVKQQEDEPLTPPDKAGTYRASGGETKPPSPARDDEPLTPPAKTGYGAKG